jgi:hypothetical protein
MTAEGVVKRPALFLLSASVPTTIAAGSARSRRPSQEATPRNGTAAVVESRHNPQRSLTTLRGTRRRWFASRRRQVEPRASRRGLLTSQVAMSLLAAQVAHGVLAQRALSTAMSEVTGMGTRRQSSEEAVEHVGAEFAVLSELGRVVVVELARALTVGAYVIELRRKTLEEYCDQSPMLDRKSVVTSLGSLIAEEGLADFVKEFGPKVIGMGVPVVHIAVGLAQVGANMREKIRTIEAHYQRGPLDAMFDLAQRVHDEQQAIDAALVFIEQAGASIESVSRAQ